MRAREPDRQDVVDRDGVRVSFEVFGDGSPAILLMPSWQIVHSRQWKAQVPYLSRTFTVVTFDARGNGRSDRPTTAQEYGHREIVADAIAVLDAAGIERAALVGASLGGLFALEAAAWYPDRVRGVFAIAPTAPFSDLPAPGGSLLQDIRAARGIGGYCAQNGIPGHREFVEMFAATAITEPHQSKAIEDLVTYGTQTTAEVLALTSIAPGVTEREFIEICHAVRCPAMVVHGDRDAILPHSGSVRLAALLGVDLVTIEGGGHSVAVADPVRCNLLIREFVDRLHTDAPTSPPKWTRALHRRRRALYVCSPIGLGHVRRDMSIADELRKLRPDLEIDWLTQPPVIRTLMDRGERVHPASRWLASESAHIEDESGEHDLHAFQALRRMDEILVANFMVFRDLSVQENYDLVVADEGWDIDYFLHENPELKRSAFAWLTDFVGFLPMPDGGSSEMALTGDYNAEMIEHIARYPRLRDRSIFIGDPEDLVSDPLGPGLPGVREWTEQNFEFPGYVTSADPPDDRLRLRSQLGYHPDEQVCLVTVGGSGTGRHLLNLVIACYPAALRQVPGLRMRVVTGPRIDPASITAPPGVELRGYVPDLHRELAACDIAVVQGGLTTTMELVAAQLPFIYFPLAHHFEQQIHVPHRLGRYRAGRRMDYAGTDPGRLAAAIADELNRPLNYRPIRPGGARRVAELLEKLI